MVLLVQTITTDVKKQISRAIAELHENLSSSLVEINEHSVRKNGRKINSRIKINKIKILLPFCMLRKFRY